MSINQKKKNLGEFRSGDAAAFQHFYQLYVDAVYHYAYKLAGSNDSAQDVCQKTFICLFESREKIVDEDHLRRYLFTVARNYSLMYLRQKKTKSRIEKELNHILSEESMPIGETQIILHETLARLSHALDNLPPQQRKVMRLLYKTGEKVNKVAKIMGLSEQTVRNHRAQAIRYLQLADFVDDLKELDSRMLPSVFLP